MKTYAKLGLSFRDLLGARLGTPDADDIGYPPDIVRERPATA